MKSLLGRAWLGLLVVSLGLARVGVSQVPTTRGRASSGLRGSGGASPVAPSLQAEILKKQAEQLRLKAYDMTSKADEMRDSNKDDAADTLDGRAEALFDRAKSLEETARQIELSGGQHPERVNIPDL